MLLKTLGKVSTQREKPAHLVGQLPFGQANANSTWSRGIWPSSYARRSRSNARSTRIAASGWRVQRSGVCPSQRMPIGLGRSSPTTWPIWPAEKIDNVKQQDPWNVKR